MPDPTRVLCVDDHEFVADGIARRLESESDLEYAGWLSSAEDLVDLVVKHRADIVLLDLDMPGPDAFDAVADLKARCPQVRVIVLSAYVRDSLVDTATRCGAWGYVSKGDPPASLVECIRSALSGTFALGPGVLAQYGTGKSEGRPLDLLTPREIQVLRLIGQGMSRQEIAETLGRSVKTVDNHRASIMEKLNIHDRVELARLAIREGIAEA